MKPNDIKMNFYALKTTEYVNNTEHAKYTTIELKNQEPIHLRLKYLLYQPK